MIGSFKIQQMTRPANEWIWSLFTVDDRVLLSKSGYRSPEDAGRAICEILTTVGLEDKQIDIWIEKKVRTRFRCDEKGAQEACGLQIGTRVGDDLI